MWRPKCKIWRKEYLMISNGFNPKAKLYMIYPVSKTDICWWSFIYFSYSPNFSGIILRCFVFDLFKIKIESCIIASIYFNYVREITNFHCTCLFPNVHETCSDNCSQATSKHQENVSPANKGKRWDCYKVQVSLLVTSRCKTFLNFCRNVRRRWSRKAKWTA
jgi:hypothetical protein